MQCPRLEGRSKFEWRQAVALAATGGWPALDWARHLNYRLRSQRVWTFYLAEQVASGRFSPDGQPASLVLITTIGQTNTRPPISELG